MQLVVLFLCGLLVISTVHSFRDYPANYTSSLASVRQKEEQTKCNCTVYEKSLQNVLSRKKRAFVFFRGTLVALTDVAAKVIIATSPKPIYQSNEVDFFYDVPLLVEGWRKPFIEYVEGMKAQKKKFEQEEKEEKEEEALKNVGVVNASAIPLDDYLKMPLTRPNWSTSSLNYEPLRNSAWNRDRGNHYRDYSRKPFNPYNRDSTRRYYPNSQRRNYVQQSSQNWNYSPSQSYPSSFDESDEPYQPVPQNTGRRSDSNTGNMPWYHHREFRERRGIYEHFEKFGDILGVKLRKCILRAICEMKEELLPKGESFINDVARILFTVPTDHDNHEDEYTQMALEENVNCARRFMLSCPHSPINYFFNNFRTTGDQPQRPHTTQEVLNNIIYA